MKFFLSALLLSITFQNFAVAQEAAAPPEFETVVKETKFNSSSRVVIDREEIQKSRSKNITTLLATQANVAIVQSNFSPTSIFMRGGDSGHILILVDGIPYYDASTNQRTISLNSFDLKSIQKIEVIKGSQSVLYGGQALTGIIKIDTIPKEIKASRQVLAQAGNFNQKNLSANGVVSITENFGLVLSGNHSSKDALSPLLDSDKKYPSRLGTADLALVHYGVLDSFLKVQTSFDRTFITSTIDNFSAVDADDFTTSTYRTTVTGSTSAKKSFLKPSVTVSHQYSSRLFEQSSAAAGGAEATKQDYVGELTAVRLEAVPYESTFFNLRVGGSYHREKMIFNDRDILQTDAEDEFEGIFAKAEIPFSQNWQIELGERIDYRKMKSPISSHQVGLTVYEMFKLEYATGFKYPGLFQLYASYGNPNLKPERAVTYSASFERNITSDIFTSVTLFETKFDDLVASRGAPPNVIFFNTYSRTKGVEAVGGYRWPDIGLSTSLTLGYQEPRDLDQNNWLSRRPLRTASLKIREELEKVAFGVEVQHVGDRRDREGATRFSTIVPYTLVHATVEGKPTSDISIFGRAQNLFNQRFESNNSFHDEGLNLIAGAEVGF